MAYAILEGRQLKLVDSVLEWAKYFGTANRTIAKTQKNDVTVSTVFLGLDHSFGDGAPLWFETLVFGGVCDGEMNRCTTYEEAEKMHKDMCEIVFRLP